MRQGGRRHDSGVFDAHAVMYLVTFLQAAQDCDGVFDIRLADKDKLEATFEGGVLFDVFTVLIERGRADGA